MKRFAHIGRLSTSTLIPPSFTESMMADWFYTSGADQFGPFDGTTLRKLARDGRIQPTDSVWREGLADWVTASTVKGLFASNNAIQPPAPVSRKCANCGTEAGALQQLWSFNGHQVCKLCRDSLTFEAEERQQETLRQAEEQATRAKEAEEQALQMAHVSRKARENLQRDIWSALISPVFGIVAFWVLISPPADFAGWACSAVCFSFGIGFFITSYVKYQSAKKQINGPLLATFRNEILRSLGVNFVAMGKGIVLFIVGSIILGVALGGVPLALHVADQINPDNLVIRYVAVGIGLTIAAFSGIFGLIWARSIEIRQCPNCGTFKGTTIEHTEFLGQETQIVKGSRMIKIREGYKQVGPIIANMTIPTEQTVVHNRYAVHRYCTKCANRWITSR